LLESFSEKIESHRLDTEFKFSRWRQ